MGTDFAFTVFDRSELVLDLLSYKGMSREARIRKKEAEEKKAAKEAAKAAKAAGGTAVAEKEADAGDDEGQEG